MGTTTEPTTTTTEPTTTTTEPPTTTTTTEPTTTTTTEATSEPTPELTEDQSESIAEEPAGTIDSDVIPAAAPVGTGDQRRVVKVTSMSNPAKRQGIPPEGLKFMTVLFPPSYINIIE